MTTAELLIRQEASRLGVPPELALAVAQQETGLKHYSGSGVIQGGSGEVGMFQILPTTAADLGINPYDLGQNVQGGVSYLRELYDQTGDWGEALVAYNGGIGNWMRGTSSAAAQDYSAQVLARAGWGDGSDDGGGGGSPYPTPRTPDIPAILTPWDQAQGVYGPGAVFSTTVEGEAPRTALWVVLGLAATAVAVQAVS